ncbi:MAG TPA: OmpA family protein, partial [Stellaceae bacterium]|nr:OmpA family protein [Stellaceae bacterium]
AVTPALAEDAPAGTLVPGAQLAQVPPPPPMPMMAPNWTGFYLGGFLGGNTGATLTAREPSALPGGVFPAGTFYNGTPFGATYRYKLQGDIMGGGTLGFNWQLPGSSWLLGIEGEGGRLRVHGSAIDPNSLGVAGDSKDISEFGQWYGAVTGRVGFLLGTGNLLLYGKGGIGFTDFSTQYLDNCSVAPCGPGLLNAKTSKTEVFPVGGGGLEYLINPSWSVKVEYLYMGLSDPTTICAPGGGTAAGSIWCSTRSTSEGVHTVKAGINFHFGAPPPPPPAPAAMPAPAAVAPRVFIVFFDWDKDRITPEGMGIIDQAAAAYKSGAPVQIQVTGYTDRSGSPGYNQRLSERRANNVAKALAARGIPPAQMVVSGHGENDNRVPTADGVREPQNRRVEIIAP